MTPLKIYYDGKLDYKETYVPAIKQKIIDFGWAFNDWIVDLENR